MRNKLGIKPMESKTLIDTDFQTVEQLQTLLDRAIEMSNQHPSVIYVDTKQLGDFSERQNGPYFTLEAEALSDGSVVYNITIE